MISLIRTLTSGFALLCSNLALAGSCERLDCDCVNIPNTSFQRSCVAREQYLRESCLTPDNDVIGYCAIHGRNAFPVAISLSLPEYSASEDIESSDRQVAQLFWSIRQDASFSKGFYLDGEFDSAIAILKISTRNLQNLLKTQLSVAEAWQLEGKNKKRLRAWKNYSEDTADLAEFWGNYLNDIGEDATVQSKNKKYHQFREKLSDLVALMYEQAGFGFANAEKYRDAAEAWKMASTISSNALAALIERDAPPSQIDSMKDQTSSRLHRASLHWLTGSKQSESDREAEKAIEFASDKLLQEILTGAEGEEY